MNRLRTMGRREWLVVLVGVGGLAAAIAIRAFLLPKAGLAGDDEGFLRWVRFVNRAGLPRAYDQPISFPAVMPWLWWLVGSVAPGILNQAEQDPTALALLKLPAALADLGIAAIVAWSLRAHPRWAVLAGVAILLVPATWYVSAWWGQFESLYVLPVLAAWLLVARGRFGWAAVALAIGLMAKPQALPLAVPFAAYYLRRTDLAGSLRAALVGAATIVVLWAPFLPWNGPAHYLKALETYTAGFNFLSLRAWNPWWMLQDSVGSGRLVADDVPIVGPVTLRWIGIAIAGLLELAVFLLVWRRATPNGLAWGLAAASLGAFVGLTEMHERYAYAAVVFLLLAWPSRLAVATWVVVAMAVTLNLIAAVPPSGGPGALIPISGGLGTAGSLAMTFGLFATLWELRRREPDTGGEPGTGGGATLSAPIASG